MVKIVFLSPYTENILFQIIFRRTEKFMNFPLKKKKRMKKVFAFRLFGFIHTKHI